MAPDVEKEVRSSIMAQVRGKDTTPELLLRKALFRQGFRYRLHTSALPGKPDLVFPRYNAVIFINGCFWHWHGCCRLRSPVKNAAYWQSKIARNQMRDIENYLALHAAGWRVLVVWECALKRPLLSETVELVQKWLIGKEFCSVLEPEHDARRSHSICCKPLALPS